MRSDTFGVSICSKPRSLTRRGVLSAVSSMFDRLGFLPPFILTEKQIRQDLWCIKLRRDEEIPPQYMPHWKNWLPDLQELLSFSISHCLMPAEFDASEDGYGSVSYLRLANKEGNIHCTFLFGKSCVTPLKAVTIPCLELSAATMSEILRYRSACHRCSGQIVCQYYVTSRMSRNVFIPLSSIVFP